MTGFDMGVVRDTLVSTFDLQSFDAFLLTKLNVVRGNLVAAGGLRDVILQVLQIADQEGWDALLIRKAAEERPLRADVQEMARRYGKTLVGQFKLKAAIEQMREAYREFGLAPPVDNPQLQEATPRQHYAGLEQIVDDTNPMLDFSEWVTRAARVEGRVCRIDLNGKPKGTGFLVGPNAVLTNYHVLESVIADPKLLPKVKGRFDYKQLKTGNKENPDVTTLAGTLFGAARILDSSPPTPGEAAGNPEAEDATTEQLDYALVELDGAPGEQPVAVAGAAADGPKRGWIRVPDTDDTDPFQPGFPVLIAQHPDGEPLRLAIDRKGMIGPNDSRTRVKYTTNTKPGSSGSPCFDRNWNLIALHHFGDKKYVKNPRFNQAVPVAAIRQRLADRNQVGALGGDCD
jgi:hypothetical protein